MVPTWCESRYVLGNHLTFEHHRCLQSLHCSRNGHAMRRLEAEVSTCAASRVELVIYPPKHLLGHIGCVLYMSRLRCYYYSTDSTC